MKRQTGIQKGEKRRIKQILRQFVPDLFFHPRQPVSDDEREDEGNNHALNIFFDITTKVFFNQENWFLQAV